MKFSIKDFFSLLADLATFTKEIINEKLYFLCSEGEIAESLLFAKEILNGNFSFFVRC